VLFTALSAGAQQSAAPAPPADQIDLQKIKVGQDFVTLNFSNIEIAALVKVMSELTRRNFIIDERVAGKVTLMTPTKISVAEAYQVFLSALEIKGFTAVEDGKVVRIIPTASARQSGLKVLSDGDFRGEGYVTKLIRMTYVNPQEVVRTLTPLITKDGSLIAYPATNSLIITDSVHNIKKIESLIRSLDVPAPEGKGKINVYYLRHANAEDIAKALSSLVARLPVAAPGTQIQQPAGPTTILEGTVTITADKATNSLIIVASPGDYETIKDVLQKLDIRRRQVYVEAAIIEMGLSKQRELGFEFQAMNPIKQGEITAAGGTNFGNIGNIVANGPAGLANMNGLAVGAVKGTFTFKGVEFLNVGALLRALQTDGDVNILSTPNILTTDNQKAEIMVGENVPFVTGQTQSAVTGGSAIQTSVERKDVGITLKITPQITSDDNVRLDLYQEISSITETAGLNPNVVGPSTTKRSATTTVVIKDRETMVIGGLIRDNVTATTSKVPLLGDIPILGWLFKYKTSKVEKVNLMIFITPYIIKNEADAAELTKRKGDALERFRDEYRIEKKDMGDLIESKKPGPEPATPAVPADPGPQPAETGR
jgi:general secretion pathway protein D